MRVLLSGATGFVGHLLEPVLRASGHDVVCGSRDPDRARARWPERAWTHLDLDDRASIARAMEGCDAAYYLVHAISTKHDYPEREAREADRFAIEARAHGLRRVVYLGGVAPSGRASRHLRSRLRTGELLRTGAPCCVELRAAMIIGEGSASWAMVRDLSARLPAMVLPQWTQFRSAPVAIDDVLIALSRALELDVPGSCWLDVPGPELMTHEELLRRVSAKLGHRPAMVPVPVLTPSLSSWWVALVTDVGLAMARELVQGLQSDLVPSGDSIWDRIADHAPITLELAVDRAMRARRGPERGLVATLVDRARLRSASAARG
ncbi:NAD(P)H-binding protein [Sandaracinus amylolyticus]|uniref:Putative oxidoreductase n=1 Tax=Sandaracinus amylolyticus TaxID=927083 RepID=A0A0F6YLS3_9BACT|nr:NAD(P)H-binding protein [Sandaracinus amylolyticus]AKF09526.1 putative oxidoreductase [Sandaracinus amylolyticus]